MTDKTSFYTVFGTDKDMEQTGIVLNYGKAGKIRIARAGGANAKFAKVLEAKMRPHRSQFENGTMDNETANDLLIEAFAEAVVLGWEGVTDAEGKEIKFSTANVVKVFKDLPELFTDVREQATKIANFRAEEVEADAGN